MVDNLNKDLHGVFTQVDVNGVVSPATKHGDVLGVIDDGWIKVKAENIPHTVSPNGLNWVYVIDMVRQIGIEGGENGTGHSLTRLLVVVKANSEELITAYPVR